MAISTLQLKCPLRCGSC